MLAGTTEARRLAQRFEHKNVQLLASLAGVTTSARHYACETRVGGFGGVGGLVDLIDEKHVVALVDATHPYAARISANAREAAAIRSLPYLALMRPEWPAVGQWHVHASVDDAVTDLPRGAVALVTTGRESLPALRNRPDVRFVLRSIEPLEAVPDHVLSLIARPPFTLASEVALMKRHGITHLLTKNSGGDSRARIDAAVSLDLPIHVLARPSVSAANEVETVDSALLWLADVLGD